MRGRSWTLEEEEKLIELHISTSLTYKQIAGELNRSLDSVEHRIRQLRKNKKLSLDKLGSRAELSKSFLSEMERGKKQPRLETLQRIARELGVSAYFFFKE